jgi:hypothetical protein
MQPSFELTALFTRLKFGEKRGRRFGVERRLYIANSKRNANVHRRDVSLPSEELICITIHNAPTELGILACWAEGGFAESEYSRVSGISRVIQRYQPRLELTPRRLLGRIIDN